MAKGRRTTSAAANTTAAMVVTALAAVAILVAVNGRRTPRSDPEPLVGVLVAGCHEVRRAGECLVVSGARLELFVPAPDAVPSVYLLLPSGPSVLPIETRAEVAGGVRVTVHPPDVASATELAIDVDGPTKRRARVVLASAKSAPTWLAEARGAKSGGEIERARTLLDSALQPLDASDAADASSLRARLLIAAGDSENAASALAQSAQAQRSLGRVSLTADDELARAFVLLEMRLLDAASDALVAAERDAVSYPEGLATVAYHRGELARARGEMRRAIEALSSSTSIAERIGYRRLVQLAAQLRALVLVDIGRPRDALALLDSPQLRVEKELGPCDRADLANNRGWAALVLAASSSGDSRATVDPLPPLLEAERGYEACRDARRLANARVNVAWARLIAGDVASARVALAGAYAAQKHLDALVALFAEDLEGRILLAERSAKAAADAFERAARTARGLALPLDEARAEEGIARALFALGDLRAADAAATRAERIIEAAAVLVALGEGRGTFRSTRDGAARIRVEVALAENDLARALAIARASRAQTTRDLVRLADDVSLSSEMREERAAALAELRRQRDELLADADRDWELPVQTAADAAQARRERALRATSAFEARVRAFLPARSTSEPPRAVADGEVALVVHPGIDAWIAFCVTPAGTHVHRFASPRAEDAPAALASALVAPFERELASARRVSYLGTGTMRGIDVHALPWRGEPLGTARVVVYPLDIAVHAPVADGRKALVIADPRGDLRAAAREREIAADALRRRGAVEVLSGASANRERVLDGLRNAAFVHYAGHATHAGPDGWDSEILLARGTKLGVADIATLERVPSVVVLSACDAAREVGTDGDEHVGIAQAFVAARAGTVIAATRPATATARHLQVAAGPTRLAPSRIRE